MRRQSGGGILDASAIRERVKGENGMIVGFDEKQLYVARYDLRMARDGCILPGGERYEFRADPGDALENPLVLYPGDSAWVSTMEKLRLPRDISAHVTLKGHLANYGVLLLSGNVVDPTYGLNDAEADGRLRFFIAHLGTTPVVIEPEDTSLAALQFHYVASPDGRKGTAPQGLSPPPSRLPRDGLGFFDGLRDLRGKYEALEGEVRQSRSLMSNLFVLGYFVLATAIISAGLATLLSIGADPEFGSNISGAVPEDGAGKVLLGVVIGSTAWIIYSIAIIFRPTRSEGVVGGSLDYRWIAVTNLRRQEYARLASIVSGVAMIGVSVPGVLRVLGVKWESVVVIWPVVVATVAFGVALLAKRIIRPIDEARLRKELERIARGTEGGR